MPGAAQPIGHADRHRREDPGGQPAVGERHAAPQPGGATTGCSSSRRDQAGTRRSSSEWGRPAPPRHPNPEVCMPPPMQPPARCIAPSEQRIPRTKMADGHFARYTAGNTCFHTSHVPCGTLKPDQCTRKWRTTSQSRVTLYYGRCIAGYRKLADYVPDSVTANRASTDSGPEDGHTASHRAQETARRCMDRSERGFSETSP